LTALRKVVLLVAVAGLLVVADVAARRASESQLEHRILDGVSGATAARVRIDSLPFLGRLAVSGQVPAVHATAADVTVSRLRFSRIAVDLHEVRIDRTRFFRHRQVDLEEVERGFATAEITQDDLRAVLGNVPVVLDDGRIGVTIGGVTASVSISLQDNVLRLTAGRLSIPTITLPRIPLLPCVTDAVVQPGRLHLSCTLATVPDELLREVNRQLRGDEPAPTETGG
jgi:LmeA-like phospholipid-binding